MRKKITLLCFFLIGLTFPHAALAAEEAILTLRYFNKNVYYKGDPIFLKVTLSNPTGKNLSFKVTDERAFNLDLRVSTLADELLAPSRKLLLKREESRPFFFREFSLHPDEEYSFTVSLANFVTTPDAGEYLVEAIFYPDLEDKTLSSRSNRLRLSILPSLKEGEDDTNDRIAAATKKILQTHPLAPDAVVTYTLRARQKSHWPRFFLYLDLEALMLDDESVARVFPTLSEEERIAQIASYREKMVTGKLARERELITIPDEFSIIQTTYNAREAEVLVKEIFHKKGFSVMKRYTYFLKRVGSVWLIYDYSVENLGTL